MENLDRFCEPTWVPNDQDMLHGRLRTTGISENVFESKHNTRFKLTDVGGQRSERKKWIQCFTDVTALLFIASLSGYDQCMIEDTRSVGNARQFLY